MTLGLTLGSTVLRFDEIWSAINDRSADDTALRILLYVRLPRTLASVFAGAALSVSGAVTQSVLSNRLASPSIIGVNSGAGLAVTVCTALGLYGGWEISFFAFWGAFAAVAAVTLGAKKWGASRGTVILMGVAMNSFLGAITDTVTTFDTEVGTMSNDFKIGDFSGVTYQKLLPVIIITVITLSVLFILTRELDVLTLGEENARGLGLNTNLMQTAFLILAALLAGAAVSISGLLSFVGLIVPHAVRRFSGSSHRKLLPLCSLFGGGFVCLCDTLARTVFSPYEIPVGVIMAFLGAPFFVFILIKRKGDGTHD